MSANLPNLRPLLNKHNDGSKYVAISRGSWSWMKIRLDEVPALCNELMDLYESEQK